MKKIKLITPILVGSAALASSAMVVTSCEWGQDKNILTIEGGEHELYGVPEIEGRSFQPWNVSFNGEILDGTDNVHFGIRWVDGYDLPDYESSVEVEKSLEGKDHLRWTITTEGTYKFEVVASYRWRGKLYSATTGKITLNITQRPVVKAPQGEYGIGRLTNIKDTRGQYLVNAVFNGFEYHNVVDPTSTEADRFVVEVDTHGHDLGNFSTEFQIIGGLDKTTYQCRLGLLFGKADWATEDIVITISIKDKLLNNFYILRNADLTLRASYEVDSWENLVVQANKGLDHLKNYYHLDTFVPKNDSDLSLNRLIDIDGVIHEVRVIGENHDFTNAAHTKTAALTFEFANVITYGSDARLVAFNKPESEKQNIWWNGEQSSDLRDNLNSDVGLGFLRSMPLALQAPDGIKTVYKPTSKGNKDKTIIDSPDKVWLLSATEIGGGPKVTSFAAEEGTCYDYYNDKPTIGSFRRRMKSIAGVTTPQYRGYWLRSPCVNGDYAESPDYVSVVDIYATQGGLISWYLSDTAAIAPCFCI